MGVIELEVAVESPFGVDHVDFSLWDYQTEETSKISSDSTQPYQLELDSGQMSAGLYRVQADAYDRVGRWGGAFILIEVLGDQTSPTSTAVATPVPTRTADHLPSTLSLTGGGQLPVGQEANISATVKSSDGKALPGVAVRFSTRGANQASSSRVTDLGGVATFNYTGAHQGLDTIRAFADTNNDTFLDPGEPSSTATVEWIPFFCIGGVSCNGKPYPRTPLPDPFEGYNKAIEPILTPAECVVDVVAGTAKKALQWAKQVEELQGVSQAIKTSLLVNGDLSPDITFAKVLDALPITGVSCVKMIVDTLAPGQLDALNECLQRSDCRSLLLEDIDRLGALHDEWSRNDMPLTQPGTSRTWLWGPAPNTPLLYEQYASAYVVAATTHARTASFHGWRNVMYFDKSRMEITYPDRDPTSSWYVTNGLLVVELITGRMQVGDSVFEDSLPADEAVAGDPAEVNKNAPTYRSFRGVAYPLNVERAPRRSGQVVASILGRDGNVSLEPALARYNVTLDSYDEQLGHNIPKVFTDFFSQEGLVYEDDHYRQGKLIDALFVLGLPISEPYWSKVRVAGVEKDVLMQAFERRVLTYTPSNDPAWRVEMGNVGQHYLRWRYGR